MDLSASHTQKNSSLKKIFLFEKSTRTDFICWLLDTFNLSNIFGFILSICLLLLYFRVYTSELKNKKENKKEGDSSDSSNSSDSGNSEPPKEQSKEHKQHKQGPACAVCCYCVSNLQTSKPPNLQAGPQTLCIVWVQHKRHFKL